MVNQHKHDHVYYVSEEINLAVRLIPLLLHSFGLYLLHILRHQQKHHKLVHIKLIQHLSISELGLVFCSVLISALLLVAVPPVSPTKDGNKTLTSTTEASNPGAVDLSALARDDIITKKHNGPSNESIYGAVIESTNSTNGTTTHNATKSKFSDEKRNLNLVVQGKLLCSNSSNEAIGTIQNDTHSGNVMQDEGICYDNSSRKTNICLLYTSDAADDTPCVDLGGRRIIK